MEREVHRRPVLPDVEVRQLRHFVCVAEELSFRRAAARLAMTQPGLSRSVARLERALEVSLLARSRRGVALTDAGGEFLRSARYLLADLDGALDWARGAGEAGPGESACEPAATAATDQSAQQQARPSR